MDSAADQSIKVAVRLRPMNTREKERGCTQCLSVDPSLQQITISNTTEEKKDAADRHFTFDHAFDSTLPKDDPHHASQETIWKALGVGILDSAFDGFNVSFLAYGQTGAGKSHTMVGFGGDPAERGLIPRTCEDVFRRISETPTESDVQFQVCATSSWCRLMGG